MKISYKEFEEAIRLGLEVEFIYKGEKYSITNTSIGWNFIKYYDYSTLQVYKDVEELLTKATIESKPIKELWDQIIIDVV